MAQKKIKEARKSRPVRMTDAEWLDCKLLGGAAGRSHWVRVQISVGMKKKKRAGMVGMVKLP